MAPKKDLILDEEYQVSEAPAEPEQQEEAPLGLEALPDQCLGIILRKLKLGVDKLGLAQASPSVRRLCTGPKAEPGVLGPLTVDLKGNSAVELGMEEGEDGSGNIFLSLSPLDEDFEGQRPHLLSWTESRRHAFASIRFSSRVNSAVNSKVITNFCSSVVAVLSSDSPKPIALEKLTLETEHTPDKFALCPSWVPTLRRLEIGFLPPQFDLQSLAPFKALRRLKLGVFTSFDFDIERLSVLEGLPALVSLSLHFINWVHAKRPDPEPSDLRINLPNLEHLQLQQRLVSELGEDEIPAPVGYFTFIYALYPLKHFVCPRVLQLEVLSATRLVSEDPELSVEVAFDSFEGFPALQSLILDHIDAPIINYYLSTPGVDFSHIPELKYLFFDAPLTPPWVSGPLDDLMSTLERRENGHQVGDPSVRIAFTERFEAL